MKKWPEHSLRHNNRRIFFNSDWHMQRYMHRNKLIPPPIIKLGFWNSIINFIRGLFK